jgi:hypothetical protein
LFPPEHRRDGGVAFLNNRLVWNLGEAAMASANRFAFMRDTVRSHPFLIASWAAMGGILLGGFVTLKMLQPESRAAKVGPAQTVAEARPAPKPVAETTGSAPAGESTAGVDCDHQTWPYLSRACVEAMQAKNRAPRVISTDNLDKPTVSAIQAPTPSPATPTPSPVATRPPTPAPVMAETTPPTSPAPANPTATAVAAPQPSPGASAGQAQAEEKSPQPADQREAKPEKHERVAKKAKRKPKVEPKALPRDESNDDDDHVANADDQTAVSDPSDDHIARGRADRRRVVERRPVREYDVPAEDGSGDRRIMVIRRDNGGGIFGNLFGGFGD